MAKITYTNKVALNENPEIALINKVTDNDLNEIKSVVNTNDDNVGDLTNLTTTTKTSIVAAVNELDSDKAPDDIILVQSSEPTSDSNILWINDGQIGTPASEITNSYSTSTGIGYSANYVNNINTYSGTETRIGTWIDGKPVYRKVIQFTTGVAVDVDIDLTSLNIKRLIKIEGTSGEDTDTRPINFYYLGNEISTRYSAGHMYVYSSSSYGNKLSYLIIEYTKTTD